MKTRLIQITFRVNEAQGVMRVCISEKRKILVNTYLLKHYDGYCHNLPHDTKLYK